MAGPNILLIVSDQERHRGWLPDDVALPHRRRLVDAGTTFDAHYTHTSPCSPSRASLYTGRYVSDHGVSENASLPGNTELDPAVATLGHRLRAHGYTTAYKGKWHLQISARPDMDAYGYGDWTGNDMAWWGLQGTGVEYDEPIALEAADWIRSAEGSSPWFLTVGLVNPHDIMWFPADQAWFPDHAPETRRAMVEFWATQDWGREDNVPLFRHEIPERFDSLPESFVDDLTTKPEVQRRWMTEMERQQGSGEMPEDETWMWLRQLDYYAVLHELSDRSLGHILGALDDVDGWDDTVVLFTSDHGDQCGSHRLRSKGPWNYEETMRIPFHVVGPGIGAGAASASLTSHVDVAATIADLAGVAADTVADLPGRSLTPLFADPTTEVRDHVLFAQDWAWYRGVHETRYASTGIFDGRYKYCRYYGVGGGTSVLGQSLGAAKTYDYDAAFEDHEHELYDLEEDPHEIVNLTADPARADEVRQRFAALREIEASAYGR